MVPFFHLGSLLFALFSFPFPHCKSLSLFWVLVSEKIKKGPIKELKRERALSGFNPHDGIFSGGGIQCVLYWYLWFRSLSLWIYLIFSSTSLNFTVFFFSVLFCFQELYICMCCVCVFFSYSFCFSGRFKDVGLLVVMWRLEDFHHGCWFFLWWYPFGSFPFRFCFVFLILSFKFFWVLYCVVLVLVLASVWFGLLFLVVPSNLH